MTILPSIKKRSALFLIFAGLFGPCLQTATPNVIVDVGPLPSYDTNCTGAGESINDGAPAFRVVQATGTAQLSVTCGGTFGLVSATGSASNVSLGGTLDVKAGGSVESVQSVFDALVSFDGIGTAICPISPGVMDCTPGSVKNYPSGSTLQAAFVFTVNGSTSGSVLHLSAELGIDLGPLPVIDRILTSSGNQTIVTNTFTFVIGQSYDLKVFFNLGLQCATGECSANYPDPDIINTLITDPVTGLSISGLTLAAADGSTFPVSSGVPEPSSMILVPSALVGLGIASLHRKYRCNVLVLLISILNPSTHPTDRS